jgi:hypothetical protein
MVSNNSAEPLSPMSSPSDAKAGAAHDPGAVLNPRDVIDVASTGDGIPTDPVGRDKPPGVADFDLFV